MSDPVLPVDLITSSDCLLEIPMKLTTSLILSERKKQIEMNMLVLMSKINILFFYLLS